MSYSMMEKMNIEMATFNAADHFVPSYDGGVWDWKQKLGYFEPTFEGKVKVVGSANFYEGEMDAETLGFAIGALLHNQLCWSYYDRGSRDASEKYQKSYYAIREAALNKLNDEQVSEFLRFLD